MSYRFVLSVVTLLLVVLNTEAQYKYLDNSVHTDSLLFENDTIRVLVREAGVSPFDKNYRKFTFDIKNKAQNNIQIPQYIFDNSEDNAVDEIIIAGSWDCMHTDGEDYYSLHKDSIIKLTFNYAQDNFAYYKFMLNFFIDSCMRNFSKEIFLPCDDKTEKVEFNLFFGFISNPKIKPKNFQSFIKKER